MTHPANGPATPVTDYKVEDNRGWPARTTITNNLLIAPRRRGRPLMSINGHTGAVYLDRCVISDVDVPVLFVGAPRVPIVSVAAFVRVGAARLSAPT